MRILSIFLSVVFVILSCTFVQAANVTLAWNANSESDIAGYKLHWGTDPANLETMQDVGNVTQATLTNIPEQVNVVFAATAYDRWGNESEKSVPLTVFYNGDTWISEDSEPPAAPNMLRLVEQIAQALQKIARDGLKVRIE